MTKSKQVKFTLTGGQLDLLDGMLHLYGFSSVHQLCRYFVEKGLEVAQTKQDIHAQVDVLEKVLTVATEDTVQQREFLEKIQPPQNNLQQDVIQLGDLPSGN